MKGLKQLRRLGEEGYHYSIEYNACLMRKCFIVKVRHVFDTEPSIFEGKTMSEAIKKAVKAVKGSQSVLAVVFSQKEKRALI